MNCDLNRATPPSASPEQKQKLNNHENLMKNHFQELQKLIANRAKSLRILAVSKHTEATMETFYQFILQLLIVLVSANIISSAGKVFLIGPNRFGFFPSGAIHK